MIFYPIHLATLLQNAADHTEHVSASWNLTWELAFTGVLFHSLTDLGITISVICISYLVLDMGKNLLMEMNLYVLINQLTWPLVAAILFANHGAMLKSSCFLIRDVINHVNQEIIDSVAKNGENLSFDGALSQVADFDSILDEVAVLRRQCDSFTDWDKMDACLEEVEAMSYGLRDDYAKLYPDATEWIKTLDQTIELNRVNPYGFVQQALDVTSGVLTGAASSVLGVNSLFMGAGIARTALIDGEAIAKLILFAFQIAIQHMIEVSMLLTALSAPVALGISLFPMPTKPLLAWITGFLSLGMFKVSYNIIIGLVAISIVQSEIGPSNTLPLTLALSILSPLLAFGIASGGGLAVFNGISQAGAAATSFGTRIMARRS